MTGVPVKTVDLVLDLTREPLTLGGALVLRQEGEILCRLNGAEEMVLHVLGGSRQREASEALLTATWDSSFIPCRRIWDSTEPQEGWPTLQQRSLPEFSYFAFTRLLEFHRVHGLVPRLVWNAALSLQAQQLRARFAGRLVGVHLRHVAPFLLEESNTDGPLWNDFLARHARAGVLDFLLLGHDILPSGISLRAGVTRAVDLGLELPAQLALVPLMDGFLGMASGICTAANLSETPHVIFKHPSHHVDAMRRELGLEDHFPFATPRQRLWRRIASNETLEEALALILP